MNTIPPLSQIKSLEDIERRKEEIKLELDERRDMIVSTAKGLWGGPAISHPSKIVRNIGSGIVIFNGVKTGLKIVRLGKSLFKRFK